MTRFDSGLRGFGQIRQQYEVQKDRWCIWHAMNDIDFSDYMVTSKPDHGGSQGHMPSNSNSLPIKSRPRGGSTQRAQSQMAVAGVAGVAGVA